MNKLFAAFLVLTLVACKEVSFKEPQPKGRKALSEIPKELRGTYLILVAGEEGNSQDTLLVSSKGYFVKSDSSDAQLGDSLVLKKYKGFYFFNSNTKPEWILMVVKKESNGDLSYMLMEQGKESFNEFLLQLNKEIQIDSSEFNDRKLYQIDPSPKKLISLIEKGYFKKKGSLKKLK